MNKCVGRGMPDEAVRTISSSVGRTGAIGTKMFDLAKHDEISSHRWLIGEGKWSQELQSLNLTHHVRRIFKGQQKHRKHLLAGQYRRSHDQRVLLTETLREPWTLEREEK